MPSSNYRTSALKFFSPKGVIGRKEYLLHCILLLLIALLAGELSESYFCTVIIFICYTLFIIQTIKRLHDLNLSAWWTLLVLVPIVNILVGAWVIFKKGNQGFNNYCA
jgi:uncharacterized membrane protein YhaH (DUF805 family)